MSASARVAAARPRSPRRVRVDRDRPGRGSRSRAGCGGSRRRSSRARGWRRSPRPSAGSKRRPIEAAAACSERSRGILLEGRGGVSEDLDPFAAGSVGASAASGSRSSRRRRSCAGSRQDVGLEDPDAARARDLGEPLEQARADALPLERVFDGEGDLGARGMRRRRGSSARSRRSVRRRRRRARTVLVVDVAGRPRRPPSSPSEAEEAEVEAVGEQAPVEREQRRRVLAAGWAAAAGSSPTAGRRPTPRARDTRAPGPRRSSARERCQIQAVDASCRSQFGAMPSLRSDAMTRSGVPQSLQLTGGSCETASRPTEGVSTDREKSAVCASA